MQDQPKSKPDTPSESGKSPEEKATKPSGKTPEEKPAPPAKKSPGANQAQAQARAAAAQKAAAQGVQNKPAQDRVPPQKAAPKPAAKEAQPGPEKRAAPAAQGAQPAGQPKPSVSQPAPSHPPAKPARLRRRHWGLLFSFLLLVLAPAVTAFWYLEERAVDQYASFSGFAVRSEETTGGASDLLGGLGLGSVLSGSSSSDTDILYEFIQSQELVERVDAQLDLKKLYSEHATIDPVFSLPEDSTLEEMVAYWQRVVRISYDSSTGLVELRVLGFTPEDAQRVNQMIFEFSSEKINDLSAIAREDATRYAREELDKAVGRLKDAREAITRYRNRTHIIDPQSDLEVLLGVQSTLQQQLAEALIEADLLRPTMRPDDPRLAQAEQRIAVIEDRIKKEREKVGSDAGSAEAENYSNLVGEYERLTVDREFAEKTYVGALSAYNIALATAQRKSRYLAAYIKPTLAQSSEYPQKPLLIGLVLLFSFLAWAVLTLMYYSIRDRR